MDALKKDSDNPLELTLINTNFEIFNSAGSYVNCYRMYLGYYNVMPNFKSIDNIDIELFKNWFEKKYENQIIKQHYRQDFDSQKKELKCIDHFYFLEPGIMLNVERKNIYLLFTSAQETSVNMLFEDCKKFIKSPKNTTDISLIISQNKELVTKEVHIKKSKIDFNIHYNEDFLSIHKTMVKQLNKKDANGLYLFLSSPLFFLL